MADEPITYVRKALFIHTRETLGYLDELRKFSREIEIQAVEIDSFLMPDFMLDSSIEHLIVSANIEQIKAVMEISLRRNISLGILPARDQKQVVRFLGIGDDLSSQIDLALQRTQHVMDVIRCNDHIVLFSASMGRMLLSEGRQGDGRFRLFVRFLLNLKRIKLIGFKFILSGRDPIETVAGGCLIVQQHSGSLASKLVIDDERASDGMLSMLIAAPASVMGYLGFLYRVIKGHVSVKQLPDTLGYIKATELTVQPSKTLQIEIDGVAATRTPAKCYVQAKALKVNRVIVAEKVSTTETKEIIKLGNLPIGGEKTKAMKSSIPFFPYATEERFKDLFVMLRQDARSGTAYFTLMILSTMLATIGLFLNSSSVIIGAMLLAPLMAPIVSLSMGILRSDRSLYFQSARTIFAGISIALLASAFLALILPETLVTTEMYARLNPSLMDLAVAILAGVAGAYTKSNKEMMSGLAGVAIAVALVPPLAVAGVGLGRAEPYFFSQAFLLFSTNLVGIIISAALTFRVLGYSAAIKAKKSFIYVIMTLALICVPLYLSYDKIIEGVQNEQAWKRERFLVNGKYLIVKKTEQITQANQDIIVMEIYARDNLTRRDLDAFKAQIERNFDRKLLIRANVTYIL